MSPVAPSVGNVTEQQRWLAFSRRNAREGERAFLAGHSYIRDGEGVWHQERRYAEHDIPRAELEKAAALSRLAARREEEAPTKDRIAKDFPELTIVDNPDGTWEARGGMEPERRMKLDQMFSGQRAVDIEQAEVLSANVETETLVGDNGYTKVVPVKHAKKAAEKAGLKPKRHYGRAKRV